MFKLALFFVIIFCSQLLEAQKLLKTEMALWGNAWVPIDRTEFEYDDKNRVVAQFESTWNQADNSYSKYRNKQTEYSNNGTSILEITKEFDAISGSWKNALKKESLFSKSGLLLESTIMRFDSTWIWDSTDKLYYDSRNNLIKDSSTWYNQNITNNSISMNYYFYNSNDSLVTEYSLMEWRIGTKLDTFDRRTYDYYPTLKKNYMWLSTYSQGGWLPLTTTLLEYNENGRLELVEEKGGHYSGGDIRKLYSYNKNNFLEKIIYQNWNDSLSVWVNHRRDLYYYDSSVNIENSIKNNHLALFPNPVNNVLNVKLNDAANGNWSLYSSQGLELNSGVFYNQTELISIDVDYLVPGTYYFKIEEEERQVKTLSFIKL